MLIDLYLQGRLDLDRFVSRDDRARRRRGGVPQDGARRGAALRRRALSRRVPIELVTTDGIFALDGGEWEVTNNIWLVGDDREVVVFDAAHDHAADRRRRQRSPGRGDRAHPRPQRPHQRRRAAARRRRRARSCCTPPTGCCGTSCGPTTRPTATLSPGDVVDASAGTSSACCTRPATPPAAAASTTPARRCRVQRRHAVLRRPGRDRPQLQRRADDRALDPRRAAGAARPDTIVHTGHGESTTIGAERDGVIERARALGLI